MFVAVLPVSPSRFKCSHIRSKVLEHLLEQLPRYLGRLVAPSPPNF